MYSCESHSLLTLKHPAMCSTVREHNTVLRWFNMLFPFNLSYRTNMIESAISCSVQSLRQFGCSYEFSLSFFVVVPA